MNRFKPGDKARVIGNVSNHEFELKETVEIVEYLGNDDYDAKGENGETWSLEASELEPIEPVQEEESPIDLNDLLRTLLAAQYEAFTTGLRKSVVPVSHIIATFSEYGVKDIGEPF